MVTVIEFTKSLKSDVVDFPSNFVYGDPSRVQRLSFQTPSSDS